MRLPTVAVFVGVFTLTVLSGKWLRLFVPLSVDYRPVGLDCPSGMGLQPRARQFNLSRLFDHIYLVNLPSRKDRLALTLFKFKQHGISAEVFPAFNGTQPKYDALAAKLLYRTRLKTRGALGILLTWQAMVKDALMHKYEYVLFFEDDVNFALNFDAAMEAAAPLLESRQAIDVAFLGANQFGFSNTQKAAMASGRGYYELSFRSYWTLGAYAVALSRRALLAVHERLERIEAVNDTADFLVWRVATTNKLRTRVLFPFPVLPDVVDSDNGGWRDPQVFYRQKRYTLGHYNYLSVTQTNRLRALLSAEGLSARQLFAEASAGAHALPRRTVVQLATRVLQPEAAALVRAVAGFLTPCAPDTAAVKLADLYRLVEGPTWTRF